MKQRCISLFLAAAALFLLHSDAPAKPKKAKAVRPRHRVAVVKSKYDDVDMTLTAYKIPHDLFSYRDLEDPVRLNGYDSLFVPSGIDNPLEESLDVYANNFRFKSVALKPDFYEVDRDKVARSLRRFVKNGGAAYFSGYSFEYAQRAFNLFEFFDNFPFMGMPAVLDASLRNDLSRFSIKNNMPLNMDHPGWIAIKSARDSEVLAYSSFETPRGVRSGPVSIVARRGNGEVLYTSYDSSAAGDFRRFNIYRVAGAPLRERLEDGAEKWGQRVTGSIVNSIHDFEYCAMHRLDLVRGNNAIYIYSERDTNQVDIFDRNFSLIESRDLHQREQLFNVRSEGNDYCFIKLYPDTSKRYAMYAVVSASGRRIIPFMYYIIAGAVFIAAVAVFVIYKTFFGRGYMGRWRG